VKVENDEDKERDGRGSRKKGKVLRHLLRPNFTLRLQPTHAFAPPPITNNIFLIILSHAIIHY